MDRVSDKWLAEALIDFESDILLRDSLYHQMAVELQSRRAAERERAAPQGDLHGETYGEACCRFTKEVDEMRHKVAEALGVCEEAAPTEPRLAKWERRLDRMSGGLHFNYSGGEGWYASWMIDGGVVKYAYGDTPKAAVKAARRAWREARDER